MCIDGQSINLTDAVAQRTQGPRCVVVRYSSTPVYRVRDHQPRALIFCPRSLQHSWIPCLPPAFLAPSGTKPGMMPTYSRECVYLKPRDNFNNSPAGWGRGRESSCRRGKTPSWRARSCKWSEIGLGRYVQARLGRCLVAHRVVVLFVTVCQPTLGTRRLERFLCR